MMKDYLTFVDDMIEGIDKILRYLDTVKDLSDFLKNEMVIDAVTRNYEIIGEAAKKIPQEVKDEFPDIPWRQMYGLRNFAVHEYHIIDATILWEIAQNYLVQNKIDLENLLDKKRR